ncbi:MAG: class I SAM-dependent methyltransferase [Flavobacteriaceae bacterium]
MKTDIISSWEKNASEWIKVIQDNQIPSRKFTNKAILEAITSLDCKNFADIGCGEGWLTREIGKMGTETIGFDAIEDLIEEAKKKDQGNYHVLTFEDIIEGNPIPNAPFDAAVFNFCLYLEEGLQKLLENSLKSISLNGSILIQTLHPFFLIQNRLAYKSQWLSDAWKGLPGNFEDGHSWYARTFENWSEILGTLEDVKITFQEVVNEDEKPISLLIKIKKLS